LLAVHAFDGTRKLPLLSAAVRPCSRQRAMIEEGLDHLQLDDMRSYI